MEVQTLNLKRFADEPTWFTELRRKALSESSNLPLPETRFTKFRGLDLHRITDLPSVERGASPRFVDPEHTPLRSPLSYFFRDGVLVTAPAPKQTQEFGLQVLPLSQALRDVPDRMQDAFAAWHPRDKLEALHLAYLVGGVVVMVPDGAQVEVPVYIQVQKDAAFALTFHTWIFLGHNATVTLIQEEVSTQEEGYVSHVVHVHLSEGSHLNYGTIQALRGKTYHLHRKIGELHRNAHLDWSSLWMGGKLTQAKTETYLRGEGAEATDSQVFFGTQRQHIDLTSDLRHTVPNTQGFVFIQGVLKDRARAVLQGMIRIEPGAQNTNSYLEEHVLLLNRGTHADAKPALEIEADEVQASHAATVSKVEDDQLFYLQTRGISGPMAVQLIARGFLSPGIQKLKIPYIRERLDLLFQEKWGPSRGSS